MECHGITLPIYANARLGCKVNFARGKIPSGGKSPENVHIMYQPRRQPNIVQSLVGYHAVRAVASHLLVGVLTTLMGVLDDLIVSVSVRS